MPPLRHTKRMKIGEGAAGAIPSPLVEDPEPVEGRGRAGRGGFFTEGHFRSSVAKQSHGSLFEPPPAGDCFVAPLLAMTTLSSR